LSTYTEPVPSWRQITAITLTQQPLFSLSRCFDPCRGEKVAIIFFLTV